MAESRLPGLLPNDPQNCLSEAARWRIYDARLKGEKIRTRTLATLEMRYRSEGKPVKPLSKYLSVGQAAVEFEQATLEAARVILSAFLNEYRAAGKSGTELSRIMGEELEACVNSWELPIIQRDLLLLELDLYGSGSNRAATPESNPPEAKPAVPSLIRRLSKAALVRMEAATVAFMAEYLPKLEREANKSGPIHDAELLREFVVHQFNVVARECMAVCVSVEEFEAELLSDIARFVRYDLSQYRWLAEPLRQELDAGFTLFVMRANLLAEIPEKDRASAWHVGAITGEALSHAALKLRAEAWKRAVEGGFPKANQAGATEPSCDESTGTEAGLAVNGTNGHGATRRALIDAFIAKLAETGRKVTRKDVWTVAGYKSRTEFERFQRGDKRTTRAASLNFNRVLGMTPEHFIRALEKKASK